MERYVFGAILFFLFFRRGVFIELTVKGLVKNSV
jgi:hypothetical protein